MRQSRRDPHDDAPRPTPREPPSPVATLGELHKPPGWWWLYCNACSHGVAIALAPYVIRWGPEASSDKLRHGARCSKCGHRGATMRHPTYGDSIVGWSPFPTD